MKKLLLTGLAAAFLAGCASIERSSPGMMKEFDVMGGETRAETTVVSRNFGFCIFYLCTLICGDINYNREKHSIEGGCLLFQDECNTSNCYLALHDLAEDEGKDLTNVNMVNNSLPSQGITGYIQFLGWLFEFEDVSCSGVLREPGKRYRDASSAASKLAAKITQDAQTKSAENAKEVK